MAITIFSYYYFTTYISIYNCSIDLLRILWTCDFSYFFNRII